MKTEFMLLLQELDSTDLEKTPGMLARIAFRDALQEKFGYSGEDRALCNKIATSIKVDVNQNFVEDTVFFETSIAHLASITHKMYTSAVAHFGEEGFFNLMDHQNFGLTFDA